jgi:hypothetical protein
VGFVHSLFDDNKGAGYQAGDTQIDAPTTIDQTQKAYGQTQEGLDKQAAFLKAIQAQNGIQNQQNVYNQFAGVANGTGPNPAQAALNQATSENIANQAALMAGQRGAGANVGLMARQAANAGGNIQQQAAGQGATMQAQQQLAALGQMGGMATNQVNQQAGALNNYNSMAQSSQANLLNSINAQNNARVGMKQNQNNANASIANTNAQGQQAMFGGALKGIGGMFGMARGGMVPHYAQGGDVAGENGPNIPQQAAPAMQVSQDSPESKIDSPTAEAPAAPAQTGVQQEAPVTPASAIPAPISQGGASGPQSQAGQFLAGSGVQGGSTPAPGSPSTSADSGAEALYSGMSSMVGGLGGGGGQKMMQSASSSGGGGGEGGSGGGGGITSMLPMLAMAAAKGGRVPRVVNGEKLAANGERVPGKAKVKGDSLKNDTVPARLSPGEIVIPRSIANSPDAPKRAAEFVAAVLAKHHLRRPT